MSLFGRTYFFFVMIKKSLIFAAVDNSNSKQLVNHQKLTQIIILTTGELILTAFQLVGWRCEYFLKYCREW